MENTQTGWACPTTMHRKFNGKHNRQNYLLAAFMLNLSVINVIPWQICISPIFKHKGFQDAENLHASKTGRRVFLSSSLNRLWDLLHCIVPFQNGCKSLSLGIRPAHWLCNSASDLLTYFVAVHQLMSSYLPFQIKLFVTGRRNFAVVG